MKRPRILLLDTGGGCEGCVLHMLSRPELLERFELHTRLLGGGDEGDYDAVLVSGSVPRGPRGEELAERLRRLRSRARVIIALGACAVTGGLPGKAGAMPVTRVVMVDYAVPGCPPEPRTVTSLLDAVFTGRRSLYTALFRAVASTTPRLDGEALAEAVVSSGLCVGCGACALACPTGALEMEAGRPRLDPGLCIYCGACTARCPRYVQLILRGKAPRARQG